MVDQPGSPGRGCVTSRDPKHTATRDYIENAANEKVSCHNTTAKVTWPTKKATQKFVCPCVFVFVLQGHSRGDFHLWLFLNIYSLHNSGTTPSPPPSWSHPSNFNAKSPSTCSENLYSVFHSLLGVGCRHHLFDRVLKIRLSPNLSNSELLLECDN